MLVVHASLCRRTRRHRVSALDLLAMAYLAIGLIFTLSFTDVAVATLGGVPVTLFLLTCAVAVPTVLICWQGRFRLFGTPLIAAYLLFNFVINLHAAKLSSVLYSMIFLVAFVTIANAGQHLPRATFANLLKAIVIAYFVNVVIAQTMVLAGVPDDFLASVFHRFVQFSRAELGVRYCGFSSEPSYAAIIVLVAFVALYNLQDACSRRELLWYGALVSYQIVIFSAVYGYLLALPVAIVIAHRELPKRAFLCLMLTAPVLFAVVAAQGRFARILFALITGDVTSSGLDLVLIDSSLFMRLAPVIEYLDAAHLADFGLYLGHGAMTHSAEYTRIFAAYLPPDVPLENAFFPGFAYDYGVVGTILVLGTVARLATDRWYSLPALIFFAMLFNANFNTQLFWFVVVVFALGGDDARATDPLSPHGSVDQGNTQGDT